MRVSSPIAGLFLAALLLGFDLPVLGITLEEIRDTPNLTPKKFAAFFSEFGFRFRKEVQSPEVFLATEVGDCDDFSTLAAMILREKGYTPRLVTVRMPGVTHVVCYIEEIRGYLDYNNRTFFNRVASCAPEMEAIAESVAKSYRLTWNSASEFTYEEGMKRLVQTVLPVKSNTGVFASIIK